MQGGGKQVPRSIYETYSSFANTDGGTILLGVKEDKSAKDPEKRYAVIGVTDQEKLISDFWNTINGSEVNVNILIDENVYPMEIDGLPIRDVFDMINMDYREETDVSFDVRWNDRITYDGSWENNLFNFIQKVMPKLTADLPRPFRMEGILRQDDTPLHKACREAMINMIIHADFQGEGTLKVIKRRDSFEFTNPGILKLPKEMIYKGGNSKARNPRMQIMLRMIGYGDTAGSGFPTILAAWAEKGWPEPELEEDTILNQVTLTLKMISNDTDKSQKTSQSANGTLDGTLSHSEDQLAKLRELVIRNPKITRKQMASALGISARSVQRLLNTTEEIHFTGGGRNGHWEIIQKN